MTVTTSAISFVDRIRRKTYSGHEERVGFRTAWAWHLLQDAICRSKKHLRVFGLDAEKAMPSYSQLLKRVHPEDRASFEKRLSQSAWRDGDFEHEYRIILPDHSIRSVRSAGQFLVNADGDPEFIGTVIDITHLKQSAVLEERDRLASEIHDSLAQSFVGICMQLAVASEEMQKGSREALTHVERAADLAQFGLSEARRFAFSLRSNVVEESGLIEALKILTERSNVPGRLLCTFSLSQVSEEILVPQIKQDLLRIAQEAISNAVRHARPTIISVKLRLDPPNLLLEIKDNGSGFSRTKVSMSSAESSNYEKGLGLANMQARAKNLGAEFEIRSAPDSGTSVIVRLPLR
jgi:signal transduction histidine kinase